MHHGEIFLAASVIYYLSLILSSLDCLSHFINDILLIELFICYYVLISINVLIKLKPKVRFKDVCSTVSFKLCYETILLFNDVGKIPLNEKS